MKRTLLTAAALLAFSAGSASAATWQVNYLGILSGSPVGPPAPGAVGGSATWTYDDVTQTISSSGTVTHAFSFGPNLIYSHSLTDLSITGPGVASASAYTCTNGPFAAAGLFRQLCAGYNFGGNQINESTVDPSGTLITFLGGDDFLQGAPQTLANNFDMDVKTLSGPIGAGTIITVNKSSWNPTVPGTFQMSFQVIPVPGAVWLFGSALGLVGFLRRRGSAA